MNDDVGSAFGQAALTGSLLVAIPVALVAGVVSFLSPCSLPLVPGYLAYVTGLTASELNRGHRGRVFLGASLFILGFTAVFVSYGALFGGLGSLLREHGDLVTRVLGVVIIGLGLLFAGGRTGPFRAWRIDAHPTIGLTGAPVLGATVGIGWTACTGPTLAAVQTLAFTEASAARGALLSGIYGLGHGLPLIIAALAFGRSMRVFSWLRRHHRGLVRLGGTMLIALGVIMATGLWTQIIASLQGWISGFSVLV